MILRYFNLLVCSLNYFLFIISAVAFVIEKSMLFNNIGNRERIKIQILYLQVMQQGTRANLCTFANYRLLIPLPVSLALWEIGWGGGGRGGRREEIKTNYINFLGLDLYLSKWQWTLLYSYISWIPPICLNWLRISQQNRSAIVIHVYLLTHKLSDHQMKHEKEKYIDRVIFFHRVNCLISTFASLFHLVLHKRFS